MKIRQNLLSLLLLIIVSVMTGACDSGQAPTAETGTQLETATADSVEASAEPLTAEATTIMEQPAVFPTEVMVPAFEPIEVTYFTPRQQEGPYYPVDKPADRDNDLVDFMGASGAPAGEVLVLAGVVYDANGRRVEGATVEIWQTDSNGVYLHPNDPKTDQRDPNFQFYGEATTGPDGVYSFWTILPGLYEPRPRHIHVKIKLDGAELLTTQFYFENEVTLTGDEANLLIGISPAEDDDGNPIWVGERDIILNIDL